MSVFYYKESYLRLLLSVTTSSTFMKPEHAKTAKATSARNNKNSYSFVKHSSLIGWLTQFVVIDFSTSDHIALVLTSPQEFVDFSSN